MTLLSWLFKSPHNNKQQQQQQQSNGHNNSMINEKEEEEQQEKQQEEKEDYNYFDALYFNNNPTNTTTDTTKGSNNLFHYLKSSFDENQPNEIVISFDTTGRMFSYFTEFKNQLDKTLSLLFRKLPNLKIAIMAHGDYCDDLVNGEESSHFKKSISILPFSNDIQEIKEFVNSIEKTDGGDAPECYEYSMRKARELPWSIHSKKTFIIIGDDVPHPPSYTDQHYYWRNELHYLTKIGIKVYSIQCHNNRHAKLFYEELATLSTGRYVHLKDLKDISNLLIMISFRESNKKNYLKDNLYELIDSDNSSNENLEQYKQKKKQLKKKFHQLFSNTFNRERDSSINIRFPWWDISFDVAPNPKYMWDSESKLFIENIIQIQNECAVGIPISLISPTTIEKSKSSTTVTPSSSYGNLFKMSSAASSPNKPTGINISNDSNFSSNDEQMITAIVPVNSSSLLSSCTTLHQENNFIKTIAKPQHTFTSFYQNSSLINTPFNNNNIHSNTHFSKAGMSIKIDNPIKGATPKKDQQQPSQQQPQLSSIKPQQEQQEQKQQSPTKNNTNNNSNNSNSSSRKRKSPDEQNQQPEIINGSTISNTKNMNLISEFIKEQLSVEEKTTKSQSQQTVNTTRSKTTPLPNSPEPNTPNSSSTSTLSFEATIKDYLNQKQQKQQQQQPKKYHRNLYSTSVHDSQPTSPPNTFNNNSNDDNDDDDSQATTSSDCSDSRNNIDNIRKNAVDTYFLSGTDDENHEPLNNNHFMLFDPITSTPIKITTTTTTTTTTTAAFIS